MFGVVRSGLDWIQCVVNLFGLCSVYVKFMFGSCVVYVWFMFWFIVDLCLFMFG